MSKKILMVDDNQKFAAILIDKLKKLNYDVTFFSNPIEAISDFANNYYDIVVTDYHMKEMNGMSLLKILKGIHQDVKTVVLTAYPEEDLEIQALDLKVDRFISKDKSILLIARYIKDLIGEKKDQNQGGRRIYSSADNIVVDLKSYMVIKDDEIVDITPKEFQLLALLMKNMNDAVKRETIASELWDKDLKELDDKSIDVLIHSLRKKLNLTSLSSVRGIGYRWNE